MAAPQRNREFDNVSAERPATERNFGRGTKAVVKGSNEAVQVARSAVATKERWLARSCGLLFATVISVAGKSVHSMPTSCFGLGALDGERARRSSAACQRP